MMTLIVAAAVAAQPAPPADQPMVGMQQHESMKKDCCKDCCKDMAKHEGHGSERGGHSAE